MASQKRHILAWLWGWPTSIALAVALAAGAGWCGWRAHDRWGEHNFRPAPVDGPAVIHLHTPEGVRELPAGSVIGTVRTGVYHAPDCGHAGRVVGAHRAIFPSADAAEAAGLRPCRTCNGGRPR